MFVWLLYVVFLPVQGRNHALFNERSWGGGRSEQTFNSIGQVDNIIMYFMKTGLRAMEKRYFLKYYCKWE